jgi:peptidoglycan/LPS O-acetylase OafA/YrhL
MFSALSVEVFFPLSGFVLAPQIIAVAGSGRLADLRVFLVRRWMRTVLPYLVPLIALSIVYGKLFSSDFFRYLFYVQNLSKLQTTRDYFPIAWSLSIEEWFYLLFPVWVIGIERLGAFSGARFLGAATLIYIVLFSALRLAFGHADDWGSHIRRVVLFREDSIAYGFLLYLAIEHFQMRRTSFHAWISHLAVVALAFALVTIVAVRVMGMVGVDQNDLAEQVFP